MKRTAKTLAAVAVACLALVAMAPSAQAGGYKHHGGGASFSIVIGNGGIRYITPHGYRHHGGHYRPHHRGHHGYRPYRGHHHRHGFHHHRRHHHGHHARPHRPHHPHGHHVRPHRPHKFHGHHHRGRAVRGVGYGCHAEHRRHGRVTVCYTAHGQPFVVAGSHRGY